MNESGPLYRFSNRTKAVQKWISSDPMREKFWGENCPGCGSNTLVFHKQGVGAKISRVRCFRESCDWEVVV